MTTPSLSSQPPTCPDTTALVHNLTAALSTTLADLEARVNATTTTLQSDLDRNVGSLIATFDRIFLLLVVILATTCANLLLGAIGHALVLSTTCRQASETALPALVAT